MNGGLAVRANLLCVTWSSARGHVLLFDAGSGRAVAAFAVPKGEGGYSDAAGVAMDEFFHLFVADPVNDRVRHFSAFGQHHRDLGVAAAAGRGAEGANGANGANGTNGASGANAGRSRQRGGALRRPAAVAVHAGEVFVAGGEGPARHSVHRFARDGRLLGVLRSCGESEGEFGAPRGLYVDGEGILVADTLAGRVQRFRRDGRFVAAFGLGARARPVAVARVLDGTILVVDRRGTGRVAAFAPDGTPTHAGELATAVHDPVALARDERGSIYVLDHGGERVLRFQPDRSGATELVDLAEHLHALGL